jgi:hypothetical protein
MSNQASSTPYQPPPQWELISKPHTSTDQEDLLIRAKNIVRILGTLFAGFNPGTTDLTNEDTTALTMVLGVAEEMIEKAILPIGK